MNKMSFDELCAEYHQFSGISFDDIKRLVDVGERQAREEFKNCRPSTPEQVLDFYMTSENYIYELLGWVRRPYVIEQQNQIIDYCTEMAGRILDFGAGIGEQSVRLASRGLDITYLDVESPASGFAKWRFAERHLNVPMIETHEVIPPILGKYDVIICYHVLEHLKNPAEYVKLFSKSLKLGGHLIAVLGHIGEDTILHLPENRFFYGNIRGELKKLGFEGVAPMLYRRVEK